MGKYEQTERGKLIARKSRLKKALLAAVPELMTPYLATEAALAIYKAPLHKRYSHIRSYPKAFVAALEYRKKALTPRELVAELIEGGFETKATDPERAQGFIMNSLTRAVPRGILKRHGEKLVPPTWASDTASQTEDEE